MTVGESFDPLTVWRDAAEQGRERGLQRYGVASPDGEAFLAHAAECLRRRMQRSTGDPLAVAKDLAERTHWEDLYLAAACDSGEDSAWRVIAKELLPQVLRIVCARRARAEMEEIVAGLPGDLASSTRGGARTALAGYDGTGSLVSWLVVIALRRSADLRRSREARLKEVHKDSDTGIDPDSSAVDSTTDPLTELVAAETRDAVDGGLRDAWGELDSREKLALLGRYRDGRRQREIAKILGLSEARLSRVLAGAVDKLRRAISRAGISADVVTAGHGDLWSALCGVFQNRLASFASADDPSMERERSDG